MTEGRSRGKQPSAGRQNKDNWEEEKLRTEKNRVEEKIRQADRVKRPLPMCIHMT